MLQEASARRPMQRALTTANSCRYFALTSTFTSYLGSVTLISKQMPAYSDLEDSFGDSNSEASASNYDMSSSSSSPEQASSDDESPRRRRKVAKKSKGKKSYLKKRILKRLRKKKKAMYTSSEESLSDESDTSNSTDGHDWRLNAIREILLSCIAK